MNNFNKVFDVVKNRCTTTGKISGDNKLQEIAAEVGVSTDRLHFYLDCLQETGVIKYIPQKRSISLTEKGIQAQRVFP
jgi:predicted transcriptional regulator